MGLSPTQLHVTVTIVSRVSAHLLFLMILHVLIYTLYIRMVSPCKHPPLISAREFQVPMGAYSEHYGTLAGTKMRKEFPFGQHALLDEFAP